MHKGYSSTLRLFAAYWRFSIQFAKEQSANSAVMFFEMIYTAAIVAFGWIMVSKGSGQSLTSQLLLYYIVGLVLYVLTSPGLELARIIMKEVYNGEFNNVIIKPINPLYHYWLKVLTEAPLRLGMVVGTYIFLCVVFIKPSVGDLVLIMFSIIVAIIISYALNGIVACIGFYVSETGGLKNAISHIFGLLQGSLIPLFLFPEAVLHVLNMTPFPYAFYWPVQYMLGNDVPGFVLLVGCGWGIALFFLCRYLFGKSIRHYEGIGV